MDLLLQDLRYAWRMLYKSPAFTITAALAVALGTASVTTMFSVVNTLLIAPAPGIGDPGSLVDIELYGERGARPGAFSYPLVRDLARRNRSLEGIAAFANGRPVVSLPGDGPSSGEPKMAMIVSGNWFSVLRVRPAAGRFFLPDEDSIPLARPVVVAGWRLAKEKFGSAAAAVGRDIVMNDTRFTIVGVAPERFGGTVALLEPDAFVPVMMTSVIRRGNAGIESNRNAGWMQVVGRLRPGVSRAAAQAELTTIANLAEKDAGTSDPRQMVTVSRLLPVPARGVGVITAFMGVLLVVSALVLLIASVNVGNMLLARGLARRKEFVVRLAIGASRGQLVRQLLTESVTLFLMGGVAGVLLTAWILRIAGNVQIVLDFPLVFRFPIDLRVLGFTLGTTFVTGVLFGLAPALTAARRDLAAALRSDAAGLGDQRQRSRSTAVIAQLAMSVLLLVSAGLFLRALGRASRIDPGYDWEHLAAAPLSLTSVGYDSTASRQAARELAARVAALPGVLGVSYSQLPLLNDNSMMSMIRIPGREPLAGKRGPIAGMEIVGRDFFSTIRLPLLAGRVFNANDVAGSPAAVVVSRQFVRTFWPDLAVKDAVGRTFSIGNVTETIVGVVADGRYTSLVDEPGPFMFLSDEQRAPVDRTLIVRASGNAARLGPDIQRVVQQFDPRLPRPTVQNLTALASTGLLPQRVAAIVTAIMGALGLILAAVGVYGVISYGVGQRTREIGVRMALGATERSVVAMVLSQGWRLAAAGLVIGLAVAALASRALSQFLLDVSPLDPIALGAVPLVLMGVALAASWIPARRAARIDVSDALREG